MGEKAASEDGPREAEKKAKAKEKEERGLSLAHAGTAAMLISLGSAHRKASGRDMQEEKGKSEEWRTKYGREEKLSHCVAYRRVREARCELIIKLPRENRVSRACW